MNALTSKPRGRRIILSACLWAAAFFMLCPAAFAQAPKRILILPFTMYAEKDLSFLKQGIFDMLSTRLTIAGKALPFSRDETLAASRGLPETVNASVAASLGRKTGADYVIFGSLTIFGDSISTDARFYDIGAGKALVSFHETGKDQSDVIPHIDAFAEKIGAEVFGLKTAEAAPAQPRQPAVPDIRKHPESLWTGDAVVQEDIYAEERGGAVIRPDRIWKSRTFKDEIIGVSVGDVDADGLNETVFISRKAVYVYRYAGERFMKVYEKEGETHTDHLGVDAADADGDGRAEIFVSSMNNVNKSLQSFVLEWDGDRFAEVSDKVRWYFRAMRDPERGDILMGQKRGIKEAFMPGVFELIANNGEYEAAGERKLPDWVNVFGFAYGDVLNTGSEMTVAFAENEELRMLNPDGTEEWRSNEAYGGSSLRLEDESDGITSDKYRKNVMYLPLRILIGDIDADDKTEVVVGKNKDTTGRLFSGLRLFKSGHIECLAWDNIGLYAKWRTREVSGHVSDYDVADVDNNGEKELVYSVITKIDSVLGKGKSYIVFQGLKQ